MRRSPLLLLLIAACSKPGPTPVDVALRSFKEQIAGYQALLARQRALGDAASKEREALGATLNAQGEKLEALLATLGPAADVGLQAKPDDPDCLEARWISAFFNRDVEKAASSLDRLAAIRGGDPVIVARRAGQRRSEGKYAEARGLLAPAIAKHPDDPNLLAEDGACASALNEFEAAVARLAAAGARRDRMELPYLLTFDGLLEETTGQSKAWTTESAIRAAEAKADDLPRVRIETSKGGIVVELFENEAPNTVANFVSLVEQQFYDGTKFHRVIADFMAQGGDPLSRNDSDEDDGRGGPGYEIAGELPEGRYRRHFRGSLSMANSGDPDSGGSQFFLTVRPTPPLDGKHTVFGRVLEGMDVVDALAKGDALVSAVVRRKRDHAYRPTPRD